MTKDLVKYALRVAAVTHETDEVLNLYADLFSGGSHVSYREVIRLGRLLSKDEKSALGITTKAHVGTDFVNSLNERGLSDLSVASVKISGSCNQAIHSHGQLRECEQIDVKVRLRASNGAVGACSKASSLNLKPVLARDADILPFADCTHPDQCFCVYQAYIDLMGELDI